MKHLAPKLEKGVGPTRDGSSFNSNTTHVWLVRHPETDWNVEKRFQSRSDRGYTKKGVRQHAAVVDYLNCGFGRVVSSGMIRTDSVAAALAETYAISHSVDEDWQECDHGRWEGLTFNEVSNAFPTEVAERFDQVRTSKSHGGESLSEVWERVWAAWQRLLAGKEVAVGVVTHATPIQLMLCAESGTAIEEYWRFQIHHGSITHLEAGPDGLRLRLFNYCPYLEGREVQE